VAFTFCQVPVVLHSGQDEKWIVRYTNGNLEEFPGNALTAEISQHIFERDNQIAQITYQTKMSPDEQE
jgi:hypothetical protein